MGMEMLAFSFSHSQSFFLFIARKNLYAHAHTRKHFMKRLITTYGSPYVWYKEYAKKLK